MQKKFEYLSPTRIMLTYEMPLNEIVLDFYDRLKSVSRGYASLDYHLSGYRESDLVKLDVLVGGEPVDALTIICHREQSYERGRDLVSRLRKLIPRQMFEIADSGRHRQPHHRARNHQRHPQERARQVLRRRHQPQAQTPRKAKGRQKAHEARRPRGHSAGSVPRRPKSSRQHRRRGLACCLGVSTRNQLDCGPIASVSGEVVHSSAGTNNG